MGFEKFGIVSFTSDAKVSPFVDYLEQGKFMTTQCRKCGKVFYPPRADCTACISSDVEWIEINSAGILKTFTVVHYGPTGFENDASYTLGIAEFEQGVRVLGRVSRTLGPDEVKIGMQVKLAPVKLDDEHFICEMSKL